jgi:ATP-dependent Clp protease adaptor protein ClpS
MTEIILEKQINVKEKVEQDVKEPSKYKVIFMNDNETPMDFVVAILTSVFRHSEQTAQELTMKIHNDGQAVVGVYSFEIAEQKAVEATKLSRENGYPLQIAIDKE